MDFVSGGYLIARPAARTPYMDAALVPERVLTASNCIVSFVPDSWAFDWGEDLQRRRDAAAACGLGEAEHDGLTVWADAALQDGRLGWPNVLFEVEAAFELKRRFRLDDFVIFGISLPTDLAGAFLEENAGHAPPGHVQAISAGRPPADGGQRLGFDVLGWEGGIAGFHSYLCNGLETEFRAALGVVPNARGFFDSEGEARRCAAHVDGREDLGEPGLWLPWLVQEYAERLT